jgi:hypothetical protein
MPRLRSALWPWRRLHRDQRGAISLLTVIAVFGLTILLGMVMNVGRQVDGKIRLQNAADDAAYSGGVSIARGYNTLAFSNHLLCDVFALTAFLREARDRNSETYVPSILAAWAKIAPAFERSKFPKFEQLGRAIPQKIPLEQQLVAAFGEWGAAVSRRVLPVMEEILNQELIPQFQRAVVPVYPELAQTAAAETARRDANPPFGRGAMAGALWRTNVTVVGAAEMVDPTIGVVDPVADPSLDGGSYLKRARDQRRSAAQTYLNHWNDEALVAFDREAKMSQFNSLWRAFTCNYLRQLLNEEFPDRNLPHLIRVGDGSLELDAQHLHRHFTFVAVVYWHKMTPFGPRFFSSPIQSDPQAFAAVRVFVPTSRLEWQRHATTSNGNIDIGGMPGEFPPLPPDNPSTPGDASDFWRVGRQYGVSTDWSLMNQHWTAQLVPATVPALAEILQTAPPVPSFQQGQYRLPSFGSLSMDELNRINTH